MRPAILAIICMCLATLAALTPAGEKGKPFEHSAAEKKIHELTNAERKNKKLPALTLNPALSKIARAHSENMARQNKMEHILDGKTPGDRVRAGGYKFDSTSENLAMAEDGAELPAIMKEWMDSKVHRANILEAEYTEIGVGIVRDKKGNSWLTQVFALPDKD